MSILTRWDPFADLANLHLGRLGQSRTDAGPSPAVDIYEDEEAITLSAELPGFDADSVQVHVDNDVLTLSGERKLERSERSDRYHRIERSYGKFRRSFMLPKSADLESIEASMDAGVLTLRVPKRVAATKRRIAVRSDKHVSE